MDRRTVLAFNVAYTALNTPAEKRLIDDVLLFWGKLEPAAKKNPAIVRRALFMGMALQKDIAAGNIILPDVVLKRKSKAQRETPEQGQG